MFDDKTGALLHSIETGASILAAPMTYQLDGVQYVSVMAAWGGGGWSYPHQGDAYLTYGNAGRILTFKLDGGPTPKPAELPPLGPIPEPPPLNAPSAQIAHGAALFGRYCALCHSNMDGSLAPDLRRMNADTHAAIQDIVLHGALKENGMPAWGDVLNENDAEALHGYLISQARQAYDSQPRN